MATPQLRKNSKWWYGGWMVNGKKITANLQVAVEGKRPTSPTDLGDARFRVSREKAQARLDEIVRESLTNKQTEALAQAVYKARTGQSVPSLGLDELVGAWEELPRRRQDMSAGHIAVCRTNLGHFVAFLKQHYPTVATLADVTHEMAQAFMAGERDRGVSGRTFNGTRWILKSAFSRLKRRAGLIENPFEEILSMEENTAHRIPFTPEELKTILDAVKDDDFCRPLIITGICTAMRRGDVCQLRWRDVDMQSGFITVNTSKTGVRVSIPMFGLLRSELETLSHKAEYCFPEQAELYKTRPDAITNRLGRVFKAAGFADESDDSDDTQTGNSTSPQAPTEALSEAEMKRLGRERIRDCGQSNTVRENMRKVFDLYMDGKATAEIASEMGISKGGVSGYFKRIEDAVGFPVIRQRRVKHVGKARGAIHASRPGLKKVNQRGFHAFRATWVTLALTAGVPMDLVRKVTGHTTADTVMTHYFQPGQDAFRKTLMAAMPTLLTGGVAAPTREEQMKTILDGMSAKTWKLCREKLYEHIKTTEH